MRKFQEQLRRQWEQGKRVCLGLDSDVSRLPHHLLDGQPVAEAQERFNYAIVNATYDLVGAYKANIAFSASEGPAGLAALKHTIAHVNRVAPSVPFILDGKRTDIGKTNRGYVKEVFGVYGADATTVNPYFGGEALQPFLDCEDKGVFVLCLTSNPGAAEFQKLPVLLRGREVEQVDPNDDGFQAHLRTKWAHGDYPGAFVPPLYEYVAARVARQWNRRHGNCGLVVGATYVREMADIRDIVGGDLPFLIPGIGAQGGDPEKTAQAGGRSILANSSSNAIFASSGPDFAEAARREVENLDAVFRANLPEPAEEALLPVHATE